MLNNVILIGRLVREPELRYTPNGIAVTKFTLACDRPKSSNRPKKETDFIDCVAWRQQAEFTSNYGEKGRLLGVEGRLEVRSWAAQDGTKRRSYEVQTWRVQFLDKKRTDGSNGQHADPMEPPGDLSEADDPFVQA
ncbi:MAG: single-stranded DNA-binding protein [Armatimonadetes bacterium]|nr:single-stranded DNA-binding protein [Armatimonadota bacterium]